MARVNLYVPDDLKARMDAVGDAINWSAVIRPLIQSAVADFEHRKEKTMDSAIERLRASKQRYETEQEADGRAVGHRWAKDTAEFADLERVSQINLDSVPDESLWDELFSAANPDQELDNHEVGEYLFGSATNATEGYLRGFIEGAQEFFEDVRDKL